MGGEKKYDLEDRTLELPKWVRQFICSLKMDTLNYEDGKQVVRSSGSVGVNSMEANELILRAILRNTQ